MSFGKFSSIFVTVMEIQKNRKMNHVSHEFKIYVGEDNFLFPASSESSSKEGE